MRTLSIMIAVVAALSSAAARANRPVVELRLVVDAQGTEFPTADGKRVRLGAPLVPAPFDITRAAAHGSQVELLLAPAAAHAFEAATAKQQGRALAIVVDGVVESAPVIRDAVKGGKVSITLRSPADAQALAHALTGK